MNIAGHLVRPRLLSTVAEMSTHDEVLPGVPSKRWRFKGDKKPLKPRKRRKNDHTQPHRGEPPQPLTEDISQPLVDEPSSANGPFQPQPSTSAALDDDEQADADFALRSMIHDALTTTDGQLVWERVFNSSFKPWLVYNLDAGTSFDNIVNMIKRRLYAEGVSASDYHASRNGSDADSDTIPPRKQRKRRGSEYYRSVDTSESESSNYSDASYDSGGDRKSKHNEDGHRKGGKRNRSRSEGARGGGDSDDSDCAHTERCTAREEERIRRRIARLVSHAAQRARSHMSWGAYEGRWRRFRGRDDVNAIPWPVEPDRAPKSADGWGKGAGSPRIRPEDVRAWVMDEYERGEVDAKEMLMRLKGERIRWHPDRFFVRFGGMQDVDEMLVKDVTAVFQVVSVLWEEMDGSTNKKRQV